MTRKILIKDAHIVNEDSVFQGSVLIDCALISKVFLKDIVPEEIKIWHQREKNCSDLQAGAMKTCSINAIK